MAGTTTGKHDGKGKTALPRCHTDREPENRPGDDPDPARLRSLPAPLLCIGETKEEKEQGIADQVLRRQLQIGLASVYAHETQKIWIAYEPVWAIGVQGEPISVDYAQERILEIRLALTKQFGATGKEIPIFYGGSVKPDNAGPLSKCQEINGLFIGRSAWDANQFDILIRDVLRAREDR